MTRAVEQGQLNRRVNVIGRDKIADVSGSVNAMLANAFNFTVGRFRRFVQRTKATAEQLDVIARQQTERSESFTQALLQIKTTNKSSMVVDAGHSNLKGRSLFGGNIDGQQTELLNQLHQTRELLRQISDEEILQRIRTILKLAEQSSNTIERLTNLPQTASVRHMSADELRMRFSEDLQVLDSLNKRIAQEILLSQQNTSRGFQEIDKEMSQITARTRLLKTQAGEAASPAANIEAVQEIARQSTQFANEVHALARQVSQMAQEIRTGIVSFQLDTVENGIHLNQLPQSSLSNPNLISPQEQVSPMLSRRKNSMGLEIR